VKKKVGFTLAGVNCSRKLGTVKPNNEGVGRVKNQPTPFAGTTKVALEEGKRTRGGFFGQIFRQDLGCSVSKENPTSPRGGDGERPQSFDPSERRAGGGAKNVGYFGGGGER